MEHRTTLKVSKDFIHDQRAVSGTYFQTLRDSSEPVLFVAPKKASDVSGVLVQVNLVEHVRDIDATEILRRVPIFIG